jgi:branched-chain amino acid transport system ATP-binding protein
MNGSPNTDPLLEVEGLSYAAGKVTILRDASLRVMPGESVGIVGPNGAGKTTLLRVLSGLYNGAQSTRAVYAGAPLPASPSAAVKRLLIHVPEGRFLIGSLTVEENIRAACYAVGKPLDKRRYEQLTETFPILAKRRTQAAGNLSGGEQQQVALARAIAVEPRLLLIDEMSLGLSPSAIATVVAALQVVQESSDMSFLIVDQNIKTVTALCSRVYGMDQGRTAEYSGTDDLVANAIRDVYLF